MAEYVLGKKKAGTTDQYQWVDDFSGINAYSEADDARIERQANDPDYVYDIFSKEEWEREH